MNSFIEKCIFCGFQKKLSQKIRSENSFLNNNSDSEYLKFSNKSWATLLDLSESATDNFCNLFSKVQLKINLCCSSCNQLICDGERILDQIKKLQKGLKEIEFKFKSVVKNNAKNFNFEDKSQNVGEIGRKIILEDLGYFKSSADCSLFGENVDDDDGDDDDDDSTTYDFPIHGYSDDNEMQKSKDFNVNDDDFIIPEIKLEIEEKPFEEEEEESESDDDDMINTRKRKSSRLQNYQNKSKKAIKNNSKNNTTTTSAEKSTKVRQTFPKNVPYKSCAECNINFNKRRAFFGHNFVFHSGPKYFQCNECQEMLGTYRQFVSHKDSVHRDKVSCPHCQKFFLKNSLKAHINLVHSQALKYKCEFKGCGRKYSQLESFNLHQETHKNQIPPTDKRFKIKSQQPTNGPLCEECGKKFHSINSLNNHKRYHRKELAKNGNEQSEEIIKCDLCEFTTIYKHYMKTHLEIHSNECKYICDSCGSKYNSKLNFLRHIRDSHKEKKFQCEKCEKSFAILSQLNRHSLSHLSKDLLPFKCEICEKTFREKNKLEAHESGAHGLGDKSFNCELCTMTFSHKNMLYSHKYYKHNIKTYKNKN